MEFRIEFTPKPFSEKIIHSNRLFLIGSCFTENIGAKLKQFKWDVLENPNGILFNPVSISNSINSYIENKRYTESDLFYHNESWHSWQHHSRFSHPNQTTCLEMINHSQEVANDSLQKCDWVLITLGSSFVYELEDGVGVANCHKIPTDKFSKKLLSASEIQILLGEMLQKLFQYNPIAKVIFTISPVRHLRDGFVENNRSKANLITAVHGLVDGDDRLFYFPAYELVIDDLRDYRFFAEDMVHPNYSATNYVWEKFIATCVDESSQKLMKEINEINAARSHKPFNSSSQQHKNFLKTNLDKIKKIKQTYPYINFNEEENYFSS